MTADSSHRRATGRRTPGTERGLCAVILAAGRGARLAPLTTLRPKPLCPIGAHRTPLDDALARVAQWGLVGPERVAVNASYLVDQLATAVGDRAHLSIESTPLGTAGALGKLRPWIAGRDVVICNADAYLSGDVPANLLTTPLSRPRLLVVDDPVRGDFGNWRFAGVSMLPGSLAMALEPTPTGLYEVSWRQAAAAGQLDFVEFGGCFIDCGTPADYLRANLHRSGGANVIGAGAVIAGSVTHSVVWPGGYVGPDEHLAWAVRADHGITVRLATHPDFAVQPDETCAASNHQRHSPGE